MYLQNRTIVPVDFEVVQCMIDMLNAFFVNSVELAELGKHFYTLHDQLLELLHNMRQFYI